LNKELRSELFRESLKQKALPVIVFFGLILFGFLSLPSMKKPTQVYGEVVGLRGAEGDGVRLYLDVQLDGGKKVLVSIPNTGAYYKKGRRLRLQKRDSNILGGNEYVFDQYVEKR